MKISVVILNWNGKNYIEKCLDSVAKLEMDDFEIEIIVVDNASSDGSPELVEKKYPDIKVLKNKNNLGYSGGNNVGLKDAIQNGADYVLVLNPDTLVDKNLLVELLTTFNSGKQIGIVGPKIYFAKGYEYHKERYEEKDLGKVIFYAGGIVDWKNILASHRGVDEVDNGQYEMADDTGFITGCAMMISKEVISKIGYFDEKYFLYWEDNDYCQRARKAGFWLWYQSKGLVWHLDSGSSKVGGELHDYFITRNRMLFGLSYGSLRAKFALVRESFRLLVNGRKWQKIGIKDYYLQHFGKGSWQ
jgi:GT2 family glycosyltransferase